MRADVSRCESSGEGDSQHKAAPKERHKAHP